MKFKANSRRRALEYEKNWVEKWKADKTFEKSVENRSKDNSYVFYDGPPFISGSPHHGTLLSSIVKDAVPRYQTMKGKRVERVWGWDCHGLPAERFTEKKLGLSSREEVIGYGIEKYIVACRANMEKTSGEWEQTVDRIGRWVDFKGAYKTMDKEYMESVWWAFKELYDKDKIYEGEKVLMYCTLDATPLSKAEVTMDAGAYQDVTDPSVYVKFKLETNEYNKALDSNWVTGEAETDDPNEPKEELHKRLHVDTEKVEKQIQASKSLNDPLYLLAWTTTPWTLPANTALAINRDVIYSEVKVNQDRFIIAKELIEKILTDEKHQAIEYEVIVDKIPGSALAGLSYKPLFLDLRESKNWKDDSETFRDSKGNITKTQKADDNFWSLDDNVYKIWAADYVTTESGTGVVHLAPTYGEEDFALAKEKRFPAIHVIDENGNYTEGDWEGENVWAINKTIAKDLKERGVVWKIDYIKHPYPHCHRCGTKLMYRAHPSWFMDIDGQREKMLEKNEPINWFPPHVKNGRFAKTVEQAPDWNISRDRFWATAMPVWKSESGKVKVVGSYDELKELSGVELNDYHRPWVDDITFDIDGETYRRTDKVMDSWFEAGSMPFAQFHYLFENKEKFESNFPGDFIVEYIGQVRAWFYYMHAMSVALFGENSFKNVIVTGNVAGNDGRKMSKSYGNYTDPNELMDKFSADSLRFLLLSSPLLNGEDFALQDKLVGDVARKLSMIWNMYDFFTMYAEVDGWEYDGELKDPLDNAENPLDVWIISRLHQLVAEVEKNMDGYNIPDALSPILPFLDDASNWYVRRSRRRFWKSEDDGDKEMAYRTLHYVLVRLAYVLAPFTPFLAEELYTKLTGDKDSIHLKDWLPAGDSNDQIVHDMVRTRELINAGLGLRMKKDEHQESVKVRQPLQFASYSGDKLDTYYEQIMLEELNLKEIRHVDNLSEYLADYDVTSGDIQEGMWIEVSKKMTPKLKREGLMREIIRYIQSARKKADLNIDDRIVLSLSTASANLQQAIQEHADTIASETLAESMQSIDEGHTETVKVEGDELIIALEKFNG